MISNRFLILFAITITACAEESDDSLTCEEEAKPCENQAFARWNECDKAEYEALPDKNEDEPWLYFCAFNRGEAYCSAQGSMEISSCSYGCKGDRGVWGCYAVAYQSAVYCYSSCSNGAESVPICMDRLEEDLESCEKEF